MYLFGGILQVNKEPEAAGDEFKIAIAGPLMSLGLGAIFLTVGMYLAEVPLWGNSGIRGLATLSPLATLLLWLGPINLMVGLFNLLPGFPLDGGRILRSVIWKVTRNLVKATRLAAGSGYVVSAVMIMTGLAMVAGVEFPYVGTGLFNGIWMMLIAWFLRSAAGFSYRHALTREAMNDVAVGKIMQANVASIPGSMTIAEALTHAAFEKDVKVLVVVEKAQPIGVIHVADLRKARIEDIGQKKTREVMQTWDNQEMLDPMSTASQAMEKLISLGKTYLPVVDGGQLIGLLYRQDVLSWLQVSLGADYDEQLTLQG